MSVFRLQARKPRTPVSPYTPRRRVFSPGSVTNSALERAIRDVQRSPLPSVGTPARTGRDKTPRSTPRRTARESLTTMGKPFELRDESGRAALSPRLNKWLTQQVAGDSEDDAVRSAARKADVEALRLRRQQKRSAAERDMNRCLVPLLRLIEETNTVALKNEATAVLLSLSLNPANANAFVSTGAFRVLLKLCSEPDPGVRANVLKILSALTDSPLTRRLLVQQGCVRAIVPHTRLKNPDEAQVATRTILALCALEQNRDDMLVEQALVPSLLSLLAPVKKLPPSAPASARRRRSGRVHSVQLGTDPRLQRDAISTLSLLVMGNSKRKLHLLYHGETVPVLFRVAADEHRPNDLRLYALHSLETLLDIDGAEYPKEALETFKADLTLRSLSTVLVRVVLFGGIALSSAGVACVSVVSTPGGALPPIAHTLLLLYLWSARFPVLFHAVT